MAHADAHSVRSTSRHNMFEDNGDEREAQIQAIIDSESEDENEQEEQFSLFLSKFFSLKCLPLIK